MKTIATPNATPNVLAVEMQARALRAAFVRELAQSLMARLRGAERPEEARGAATAV